MLTNNRYHICLLYQEYPPYTAWGGIGSYAALLARSLVERGCKVTVVARSADGAPHFERTSDGVDVYRVGGAVGRRRLLGRTVDRIFRSNEVASIVRTIDRVSPIDVLETGESDLEARALLRDEKYSSRILIQCHGSNAQGQAVRGLFRYLHKLDWVSSLRLETQILRGTSLISVPSRSTNDILIKQGVSSERIRVVPHGVDISRFKPPEIFRADGPLRVGYIGRLEVRKGIDYVWRVIEGLQASTDVHFDLVGMIHPELRADARVRLGRYAKCVSHTERIPHDEMPSFMRRLDVLLLPSRSESFGLTYAEAMATRLLVIAGRGGAGPEIVNHGESGFTVDADDDEKSTVELLRLFAGNRHKFDAIRTAGQLRIVNCFSCDRWVSQKLKLFDELLGKGIALKSR